MSRKTEKVGLVSAMGTGFEIIKALVDGVKANDGVEEDLRRILSEKDVCQDIVNILCGKTKVVWTGSVTIDHNVCLNERVAEFAEHGMLFSQFRKLYPLKIRRGKSLIELVLVQFNRPISIINALFQISDERKLQPAGVEEIIAFGLKYQKVVFKYEHILAPADSENSQEAYMEVPSLGWTFPGGLTLSTWQIVSSVNRGVSLLFIKNIESV